MEKQTADIRKPEDFNAEFSGLPIEARTILDDQDFQRRVYELGPNLSVTFRGRDELPTVDSGELGDGRPSSVLTPDELPHVVDQDEFSEYISSHRNIESENKNLIVSATPVGIIDLANLLSGEADVSDERAKMRANFLAGNISEKENAVLDMISTAFLDIEQGDPLAVSDGLMDVALALAGDKDKLEKVHEKVIILSTQERGLVARELGEDALVLNYEHEPLDPSVIEKTRGLVLVRTTDNEPKINEDGSIEMLPASAITRDMKGSNSKKTESFVPRQTTHFSLNHFVRSHIMGNFENRGYVVIAPLVAALEFDQRPACLFGVDTYFATGPGESVKLPEARIIESAINQENLIVDEGVRRLYKTNGYKLEDLPKIIDECRDGMLKSLGISKYNIKDKVLDAARTTSMLTHSGDLYDYSYENVIGRVLSETEIDRLDYEEIVNRIAGIKSEALDIFMTELVKSLLVDTTIIEQGGSLVVPDGTSSYIENTGFDNKIIEISKLIHSKTGMHSYSDEARFEQAAIEKLHSKKLTDADGKHSWKLPVANGQNLNRYISSADISHRLKRGAIEAGLITVRAEDNRKSREQEKIRERYGDMI